MPQINTSEFYNLRLGYPAQGNAQQEPAIDKAVKMEAEGKPKPEENQKPHQEGNEPAK